MVGTFTVQLGLIVTVCIIGQQYYYENKALTQTIDAYSKVKGCSDDVLDKAGAQAEAIVSNRTTLWTIAVFSLSLFGLLIIEYGVIATYAYCKNRTVTPTREVSTK